MKLLSSPTTFFWLAKPGELGENVSFMPPRKYSLSPFAKSEVAEDLIERVELARRKWVA